MKRPTFLGELGEIDGKKKERRKKKHCCLPPRMRRLRRWKRHGSILILHEALLRLCFVPQFLCTLCTDYRHSNISVLTAFNLFYVTQYTVSFNLCTFER